MTSSSTLPTASRRGSGARDQALRRRARQVVPGGMFGHLDVERTHLPANFPQFYETAHDATVRDVDGNEYVDLMCSWGPVLLGYAHPVVEAAARRQAEIGDINNGPSPRMVELAELLVATVAHADWAVFGKNGTDATTGCCTIARAATGRTKILRATTSYHGSNPPFTPILSGVTPEDRANLVEFAYNDLASLETAAAPHEGNIAAVIVTPFFHDGFGDLAPVDPAFATGVRAFCDRIDAVLILDEVRTGFRLDVRGSWEPLGVRPDLSAFSKAIANGHPLSAITGTDALRDAAAGVYLTGSFWAQAVPMAAAIATLTELVRVDGVSRMRVLGERLTTGLNRIAADAGVPLVVSGVPAMPKIRFENDPELRLANEFCGIALEHGAFLHPWHNWFLSAAHTEENIDVALTAAAIGADAVRTVI
ncbi:aminotransferase class III-fold pyridoxal phosphate-dependent enzyme [Actinocorallia sp. API 0066]|uniref:aminotransferase class III-fold pyridoxal phosphate-dependent enzyme n=1 Tax=Actinocorallia sp. API 0066 TaxID=2896846 RepID=UPI001E50DBEA|nr:aminotransferase class III-fold pyridoxal phosphate-dependent enzyme [Actinocorallia sp. API 0066]MCD0453333.1 aminotransferase class III-fold pyridoxal phosphate-dependent enzyme [Actinocorallia sp. API 0066]